MPKKRRTARFNRTISLSAKRPMRTPTFAFGTVVILSTMSRQTMRSPLPSLGSIRRRNRGALLGSVVNAHTVTDWSCRSDRLEQLQADGAFLRSPCHPQPSKSRRVSPRVPIRDSVDEALAALACGLLATARDCRCASARKVGGRMSGTQIWIGRSPCWRSRLRCALTLSRDDLDGVRVSHCPSKGLHVTSHNSLLTSKRKSRAHCRLTIAPRGRLTA